MKLSEEIIKYIEMLERSIKQYESKIEEIWNSDTSIMTSHIFDKQIELWIAIDKGKIAELEYYLPKIIELEGKVDGTPTIK